MILPIKCFGYDSYTTPIFPEESHVRSKKFAFPQSLYSVIIQKSDFLFFANYPDILKVNMGDNSIKLTRQFIITDEYERNEIHTEIIHPLNNYLKILLKFPYGFKFNYITDDTSFQVSERSFYFARYDQSRENYKYFILFSIGEKINFINQVQYSTKTLLSVFYTVDQLSLVHSIHPFTPQLLISSCIKMRNVGPFDFFQKILFKSEKYKFTFGLFNIIHDLKKISLQKNSSGIYLIKKFKYLTTGFQMECNQQNIFQITPVFYSKFNFNKTSSIVLMDFQRTKLGLKYKLSEKSHFAISLLKHTNNKIGFALEYISDY